MHRQCRVWLSAGCGVLSLLWAHPDARAQVAAAILRVHVTDSAGTAVRGAHVTLLTTAGAEFAAAAMDSGGRHTFVLQMPEADYELAVRLVGFVEATRGIR